MATELYTSSFFCVLLLIVFVPVRRVRMSVPHLAIILWLTCINMIRGINALVWDGNAVVRIPVWCDIATKFMLGCNVALPAAFLCISRKLELLGSSRTFSMDSKTVRNRRLLELFVCYVVPVIYVGLHPLGQDHRFDLAKDYGCSPAIHNSSLALAFIWIPPLILCSIALAFSCYSVHHTSRVPYSQFVVHLESRTDITSSIFFRQLSTSFVMTAALIIIAIFSVFSTPALVPWSSWNAVHSRLWKINVVTAVVQLDTKHVEWWIFFALSVLYIFLSFTLGEEARDALRWIVLQLRKKRQPLTLRSLHLPLFHSRRPRGEAAGGSTTHLVVKIPPPQLELKSGWDDMLDTKTFKWKLLSRKGTPSPSPPSPTPSSNMDEDKAFMVSTLSYLGSPAAKSLGISSPPHVQPTLFSPPPPLQSALPRPPQLVLEIPAMPKPSPPSVLISSPAISPLWTKPVRTDVPPYGIEIPIISMSPSPQASTPAGARAISPVCVNSVPHDAPPENMSTVSSVLRAPWPVPPTVPTPAPPGTSTLTPTSITHSPSTSRSYSPSSEGYPALTPSNRQLSPVGTVGVSTVFDASSVAVKKPLKSALKRPSRKEQAGPQGKHLRVVQETA